MKATELEHDQKKLYMGLGLKSNLGRRVTFVVSLQKNIKI